jgi:hypothetical protein
MPRLSQCILVLWIVTHFLGGLFSLLGLFGVAMGASYAREPLPPLATDVPGFLESYALIWSILSVLQGSIFWNYSRPVWHLFLRWVLCSSISWTCTWFLIYWVNIQHLFFWLGFPILLALATMLWVGLYPLLVGRWWHSLGLWCAAHMIVGVCIYGMMSIPIIGNVLGSTIFVLPGTVYGCVVGYVLMTLLKPASDEVQANYSELSRPGTHNP